VQEICRASDAPSFEIGSRLKITMISQDIRPPPLTGDYPRQVVIPELSKFDQRRLKINWSSRNAIRSARSFQPVRVLRLLYRRLAGAYFS
jgi:hypothetical protein